MDDAEEDEYARFESVARKLVNTPKPKPKPKPSAEELPAPLGSTGEPAEERPEGEEPDGDGR
jgi:hypothetical protein